MMQLGAAGLELIKEFESCSLEAYLDQRGVPTIGYGHTGPDVHMGMVCIPAQAEKWLSDDVQHAVIAVIKALDIPPTQNQFDACVSLAFNVGTGAFSGSTLVKQFNAGHPLLAGDEFLKWDHVSGVPNLGLLRRRQAEQALFLKV